MRSSKLVVGICLVFLLGAAAGALSAVAWMDRELPGRRGFERKTPEERARFIMKRLSRRLDLTEEQKRAFTPMVEKQEKESYELSRTHRKAVRALVEKSFAAMEKELTPDQRVKLVELRKKLDRHRRFQEPPSQGNGKKAAEP